MEGIALPYNAPDYGVEPLLYVDQAGVGPKVNNVRKDLDGDPFDATFWQSKRVQSVVMPWIPYFSNCDGYDTRMIFFDVFERGERCLLPPIESIRIVNPIPFEGMNPIADKCAPTEQYPELTCRFDEPLDSPDPGAIRWYELMESRYMYYVTRDPISIETFYKESEISSTTQSFYTDLVIDGSDDLIPALFIPEYGQKTIAADGTPIIPRLVEANYFYY